MVQNQRRIIRSSDYTYKNFKYENYSFYRKKKISLIAITPKNLLRKITLGGLYFALHHGM